MSNEEEADRFTDEMPEPGEIPDFLLSSRAREVAGLIRREDRKISQPVEVQDPHGLGPKFNVQVQLICGKPVLSISMHDEVPTLDVRISFMHYRNQADPALTVTGMRVVDTVDDENTHRLRMDSEKHRFFSEKR